MCRGVLASVLGSMVSGGLASVVVATGLLVPWHLGSSQTRDRACDTGQMEEGANCGMSEWQDQEVGVYLVRQLLQRNQR